MTACAGHQYDAEWSRCDRQGIMIRPGGQNIGTQAPGSQPAISQPIAPQPVAPQTAASQPVPVAHQAAASQSIASYAAESHSVSTQHDDQEDEEAPHRQSTSCSTSHDTGPSSHPRVFSRPPVSGPSRSSRSKLTMPVGTPNSFAQFQAAAVPIVGSVNARPQTSGLQGPSYLNPSYQAPYYSMFSSYQNAASQGVYSQRENDPNSKLGRTVTSRPSSESVHA